LRSGISEKDGFPEKRNGGQDGREDEMKDFSSSKELYGIVCD